MFTSHLISKKEVAERTMMFEFERPKGFTFKAGQHVDIVLQEPLETDEKGNSRDFSLVNTPSERELVVATRMRDSAFKRVLGEAKTGFEVGIEGPYGSFMLHQDANRPAIFLVGGIGITPFMSMIKNATEKGLPHKLFLFYSNHRPEDAAFLDELEGLARKNKNFVFVPTMTEAGASKQSWEGETGYLTLDMVDRHVPERMSAVYYAAGPPQMVAATRKLLGEAGVSDDDIRTEEFSGY